MGLGWCTGSSARNGACVVRLPIFDDARVHGELVRRVLAADLSRCGCRCAPPQLKNPRKRLRVRARKADVSAKGALAQRAVDPDAIGGVVGQIRADVTHARPIG
eukprot:TRINITY_DN4107_c0_g1_i1.p4 TRINITY_DN4107_c0_g1~~TRINITY_DN4107_c0_g1_i1.p4  ORF type:complete len:104 (-),score=18.72 TRINITY_DN4107_c0_g1_i1:69-380(-)